MPDPVLDTSISPLRQRLIDDMNMRRFSGETQRNYLRDIGRLATFLGRSPDTATGDDSVANASVARSGMKGVSTVEEAAMFKGRHFDQSAILLCVRWYLAYNLSLRDHRAQPLLKPIRIRQSRYLNKRIKQDHRRAKRRIRSMLGFKSMASAEIILSGIEMVHILLKRQARFAYNPMPSIVE